MVLQLEGLLAVARPKGTLYLVAFRMLAVDRDVAPSKEALAFLLDASGGIERWSWSI
jgi:hypothetical protein